jgi:DNA polymerase III delta subunit
MIYFLYGTDTHKARKKLHELLDLAQKKRPGAELFKITTENWSEGGLEELINSQGLFEKKYTVVLDNLFEKKEVKEFVLDKIEDLQKSEQIFLILEGGVTADVLKKFEKYSEKVQNFEKLEKKERFNIFGVTDGLLQKDKKKLWISYLNALSNGAEEEELHGIFFWQVKNMILVSKASSQNETGLAPFPYKNALSGSRNYKTDELKQMSSDLVEMTHRVRTGEGDLDIMLEKWILER